MLIDHFAMHVFLQSCSFSSPVLLSFSLFLNHVSYAYPTFTVFISWSLMLLPYMHPTFPSVLQYHVLVLFVCMPFKASMRTSSSNSSHQLPGRSTRLMRCKILTRFQRVFFSHTFVSSCCQRLRAY